MKFGKVDDPARIDFTLPHDYENVASYLSKFQKNTLPNIYIGCAKWNRQTLKNFYPRGTKDELSYYASQFNSVELNATFYRNFKPPQIIEWKNKTPDYFRFYPKVNQNISLFKRLKNIGDSLDFFLTSMVEFSEKLGMIFLQMPENYKPKNFKDLSNFLVNDWPKDIRLALELRQSDWYSNPAVSNELFALMEENNITHVITDTAGRRDLIHMQFTTPYAFIRYNGTNHPSDYKRLDDWFERIKNWIHLGVQEINFFLHQNHEQESPLLASYLIKRLNAELGYEIKVPELLS